jgi:hypothetical protein
MECLNPDYVTRGGQKKLAAEIGVEQNQYNNIINGTGLSNKVASPIVRRFPVVVSGLFVRWPPRTRERRIRAEALGMAGPQRQADILERRISSNSTAAWHAHDES